MAKNYLSTNTLIIMHIFCASNKCHSPKKKITTNVIFAVSSILHHLTHSGVFMKLVYRVSIKGIQNVDFLCATQIIGICTLFYF